MEFTHEFRIPTGIDEAFEVLTDLERVAPCMPGATLESVDGDTYSGRVKVKVGPMSLTYAGDATVTEQDPESHHAKIHAKGREKRGSGTAQADVAADLREDEDGTIVTVTTDLNITGKPAQFGRGVMADVGGAIIERFADNLREQLQEDQAPAEDEPGEDQTAASDIGTGAAAGAGTAETATTPAVHDGTPTGAVGAEEAAATAGGATATPSGGPRRVESRPPRDEALDILDVAGDTTTAKVVPIVAGVLLVLLIIWLLRRGDDEE